jgi:hypothetical protein
VATDMSFSQVQRAVFIVEQPSLDVSAICNARMILEVPSKIT